MARWLQTALLFLPLLCAAGENILPLGRSHCNQESCGSLDPRALFMAPRGVGDAGPRRPARWSNQAPVVPNPPSRDTVVTYSFVTATETYATQTLNPIQPAQFIGANTLTKMMEGVESWGDACGITLMNVPTNGQIHIGQGAAPLGAGSGYTHYLYMYDGSGNTYMTQASILIDASTYAWTPDYLRGLIAHEAGHSLGLTHTSLTGKALMDPAIPVIGPQADDRWYAQFLYGSAPVKLTAATGQSIPIVLTLEKASPRQTGTTSDPTYNNGAALPWGPGVGTGALTQNDILHYVVERKGPTDANFSALDSNVLAPSGGQDSDDTLNHQANQFTFSDSSVLTGLYSYRVKAVLQTDGDDIYSATLTANVTNSSKPISGAKFSASLKAGVTGGDSYVFSGVFPSLPSGFDFTGKTLSLNLSGVNTVFTNLSAKGQATLAGAAKKASSVALKPKFKKVNGVSQFVGGDVPFTAKVYGTFAAAWAIDLTQTVSKKPAQFTAGVALDALSFNATIEAQLTTKAGKSGMVK